MRTVTRFKRYLQVTTVPGDGVYLSAERPGQTRLHGRLIERIAPLLAGGHSREEILAATADEFAASDVIAHLDTIIARGYAVEADPEIDVRAAGFWEMRGIDGDRAIRRLAGAPVSVVALGDTAASAFVQAAAAVGLGSVRVETIDGAPCGPDDGQQDKAATPNPEITVVLTDDYLRPELTKLGRAHHAAGRPWLLVKPVGASLWVGPLFDGAGSACYDCLRIRLAGKHLLHSYLRQRDAIAGPLVTALTDVPATVEIATRLAALQVAAFLLADPAAPPGTYGPVTTTPTIGGVLSIDATTLLQRQHVLRRRPQCPGCGDPAVQRDRLAAPVQLKSRPKLTYRDGGHRARDPRSFVAEYEDLVSPITGPISHLTKIQAAPSGSEMLHTYVAGQNFAIPMRTINDLKAGLRSSSAGKGMTDEQARASALGEAIERYSGVFHGDEARILAAYNDLGPDRAIEPNAVHLYSDAQFANRAEWNSRPSHFHWVGDRLDPAAPVEWSPVWSLSEQRHVYVPTSVLYFSYAGGPTRFQAGSNSNGCAAGTSLEDAILQGFMELVERDAVAMWWYHRLRRPRIDLDTFDEPYFRQWQDTYRRLGRETWVLDITNDLGIPSVVAVSYRVDKPVQDILFALGSHFDVSIAIGRALSEMNQFLPAVAGIKSDGSGTYAYDDPDQLEWWQHATLEDQPYLAPADAPARTARDYTTPPSDDLLVDVGRAQSIVEAKGMQMLVLDQTRVDIGLPVVRVIVPGMRHFWPRYAPGRLYDVPVELGWLEHPTAEDDLNPVAMFL